MNVKNTKEPSKESKYLSLFVADTHLDVNAWASRPRLRHDSILAFQYICNYAIKRNIPAICGGGDLIDVKKPSSQIVQFVRKQLDKLSEADCSFYFIQGQHELDRGLPWFSAIHSWPVWLNNRYAEIGDFVVYGIDWYSKDLLKERISAIPSNTNILLMHQMWEEFSIHDTASECSFSELPYATTVFTGDLHVNKQEYYLNKGNKRLLAISPGSTNLRRVVEDENKYFYGLTESGTWDRIMIPTRRKKEFNILTETNLHSFEQNFKSWLDDVKTYVTKTKLKDALQFPICQVIYRDDIKDAFSTITEIVADNAELFIKPVNKNVELQSTTAIEISDFSDHTKLLEQNFDINKPSIQILSRLLASKSELKAELFKIKKERLCD